MKNKTTNSKIESLMIGILNERGPMTAGQLIKIVNEEFLNPREDPSALYETLMKLQKRGGISSDKIIPTQLPAVFTHEEVAALETVLKEAKLCGEKLTFNQMAERTIEKSKSLRPLGQMEQKIRFLLIPLSSGDLSNEEDEDS